MTVVAQIMEQDPPVAEPKDGQNQRVTYTLEDGTSKGRIKAFYNAEYSAPTFPVKYGRFSGTLFRKGNKNFLRVNHVRPVKDAHEIYYHLLEVVAVGLRYERGDPVCSQLSFTGYISSTDRTLTFTV